jgi:hypothetical protein
MLGMEIDRLLTLKAKATIPKRTLHTAPHWTVSFVAVVMALSASQVVLHTATPSPV